MKNSNFSPKGSTTFRIRNETLFITDNEYWRNLHLIGWHQGYGSQKALSSGEFALSNG